MGDADFLLAKPVPMCSNRKLTRDLGRSGTGEEAFDDVWVSQMFKYTLDEVKVYHDGNSCYGIQTFYLMDGTKNLQKTNDFIIRPGKLVYSIFLYTDKKKISMFLKLEK